MPRAILAIEDTEIVRKVTIGDVDFLAAPGYGLKLFWCNTHITPGVRSVLLNGDSIVQLTAYHIPETACPKRKPSRAKRKPR